MAGLRRLGLLVTLAAGGLLAATLALHAACAWIQPDLTRQLSALPGVRVHWAQCRMTPWGDLVFSGVRLMPAETALPRVAASRVVLNYRWSDLWARRWTRVRQLRVGGVSVMAGSGMPPLVRRGTLIAEWRDGQLAVRDARAELFGVAPFHFSGHLEIGDSIRRPRIVGEMALAHAAPIPIATEATVTRERVETSAIQVGPVQAISGMVDWAQSRWGVTLAAPSGGTVTVQGALTDWRHPRGEIVLDQVRVGPLVVSTTVDVAAAWMTGRGVRRDTTGTVATRGTTVNRQAVGELAGAWALTDRGLELSSWRMGEGLRLSGTVGRQPPHPLTLTVDVTSVDAAAVASAVDPGKPPVASGVVGGRIEVTGPASAPRVRGVLTGFDGQIGKTPFLVATVKFIGEGSVIRFYESRIRQVDQVVRMEGVLDLTQLGMPTVFQRIRLTPEPLTHEVVG